MNLGRKKKKTPESEISQCQDHLVKSKIGKIFENKKILEEHCVKIYELDLYFYEHLFSQAFYEKRIKLDENGCNYNTI